MKDLYSRGYRCGYPYPSNCLEARLKGPICNEPIRDDVKLDSTGTGYCGKHAVAMARKRMRDAGRQTQGLCVRAQR